MRRVLFIDTHAGLGGTTRSLLAWLRHLDPEELQPTVCCQAGGRAAETYASLPFVDVVACRFGSRLGKSLRGPLSRTVDIATLPIVWLAALRVAAIVALRRIDVVHATDQARSLLVAMLASRLTRRPLVVHLHGSCVPSLTRRMALARAAHVLASSQAIKADHVRCLGPEMERIEVVPAGITSDGHGVLDLRADLREEQGLPEQALVLAVVASLAPRRGHADLLHAFARLLEVHHDAYLLIVGEDDIDGGHAGYGHYLETLAARLGVDDQVRMLGFRGDVDAVYRTADVVVRADWEAPSSLALLEPMAQGLPVIATDVGGVTELIASGRTGILVPPKQPEMLADALVRVAEEDALRAELGLAARQAVEQPDEQVRAVAAALVEA